MCGREKENGLATMRRYSSERMCGGAKARGLGRRGSPCYSVLSLAEAPWPMPAPSLPWPPRPHKAEVVLGTGSVGAKRRWPCRCPQASGCRLPTAARGTASHPQLHLYPSSERGGLATAPNSAHSLRPGKGHTRLGQPRDHGAPAVEPRSQHTF